MVDDNADSADSLARLLQLDGHDVLTVYSAEEAIATANRRAFDVVVPDIGLPGMDGYEVVRRIRSANSAARTQLVALTGYGQPEDRQRPHAAGFAEHVVKPISQRGFETLLKTVLAAQ